MAGSDSSLTVFICTRNRPVELASALQSIEAGSLRPARVVVSDDSNDTDASATLEVASRYGADYQRGPRRGLGANRNACVANLTTPLCAFIDDDVKVSRDFVQRASMAPVGQITTGWELNFSHRPPRAVQASNSSFLGFQKVSTHRRLKSIVINATVIPARIFQSAQFDELTRYGYEELDFARHAYSLGWQIVFDPHLWVEHHPSSLGRSDHHDQRDQSRLYLTRYAYATYEKNILKALVFHRVAVLHLLLSGLRRGRGVRKSLTVAKNAQELYALRQARKVST
ncbi:glycosyltransferase family 2 protein [Microbacterium sp. PRF11]|uniref:glycosyltransferase family 2 protein n=1 Tax=Microbacterium sp. PRF11 TaxID=2962593 RepID=UPI0028824288|nr:glycosyltransferase family 2 protein [Microbacterium sp. PRF11]MDT0117734.1 glycosyltransferase family 2 protein [Microbacterium sp. PRF11]